VLALEDHVVHRPAVAPAEAAAPGADDEHDRRQRPAEADQQPVGAGHVGGRVGRVARPVPGREGEVEVDRELGQNGDQGEQGDREAAGDVDLGRLRRPREDAGGRDHPAAEHQQGERVGQDDPGQAEHDGGGGQQGRQRELRLP
jgi:hypothetical protein